LLEAAASGLPVIARKDYEPESVIDGKTGFLAATDDELMAHLAQLLASPHLCRTLGEAARCHASRFNWDVIAREWETVFTRLAHAPRKDSRS
jgi:glycosyltransferase involved in cell wall biosynthesis